MISLTIFALITTVLVGLAINTKKETIKLNIITAIAIIGCFVFTVLCIALMGLMLEAAALSIIYTYINSLIVGTIVGYAIKYFNYCATK